MTLRTLLASRRYIDNELWPDWAAYFMAPLSHLVGQICTVMYLLMNDDSMKFLSEGCKPVGQPTAARLPPLHALDVRLRIQ